MRAQVLRTEEVAEEGQLAENIRPVAGAPRRNSGPWVDAQTTIELADPATPVRQERNRSWKLR